MVHSPLSLPRVAPSASLLNPFFPRCKLLNLQAKKQPAVQDSLDHEVEGCAVGFNLIDVDRVSNITNHTSVEGSDLRGHMSCSQEKLVELEGVSRRTGEHHRM